MVNRKRNKSNRKTTSKKDETILDDKEIEQVIEVVSKNAASDSSEIDHGVKDAASESSEVDHGDKDATSVSSEVGHGVKDCRIMLVDIAHTSQKDLLNDDASSGNKGDGSYHVENESEDEEDDDNDSNSEASNVPLPTRRSTRGFKQAVAVGKSSRKAAISAKKAIKNSVHLMGRE